MTVDGMTIAFWKGEAERLRKELAKKDRQRSELERKLKKLEGNVPCAICGKWSPNKCPHMGKTHEQNKRLARGTARPRRK